LKKIHRCTPENEIDWYEIRWNKYLRKKQDVRKNNLSFTKQKYIKSYIEKNFIILRNSPIAFQHDDFIPRNIIIDEKNQVLSGIIDFNRYDWGDPWEVFFIIPKYPVEISIPFAIGQIAGYFEDLIPDDFWQKYNLFTALNFHATILGGFTYNDLEVYEEKINRILKNT
jgi:aminoglycoside phosphotransferase (APT) family kinase protein